MAKKLVFSFLFSNFLAIMFVLFFPARSAGSNIEFLLLLNSVFVFIVLACAAFFYYAFWVYGAKQSDRREGSISHGVVDGNSWFLIVLPILGIALLAYDRIYLRGVNYSQSLRAARYEWLASEGGSVFGVIGNLLVPLGYVGIFFVFKYYSHISRARSALVVASSLVAVFGHAFLNGGRSNILLYFLMVYIAFCISGKRLKLSSVFSKLGLFASILIIISVFYVASVTYSSATIGDVSVNELLKLAIWEMYGEPDEEFFSVSHSSLVYVFLYFALYLFHGQWTTQIIYGLMSHPGFHSIVSAPTVFLDKLGYIDLGMQKRAFSDTGVFISLPGAIYYDFGWIGVVLGSSLLGFIFGLSLAYLKNNYWRGTLGLLLVVSATSVLLLSPVLPVYGFSYFSFIIFSFLFLAILNLIFYRKTIFL